MSQQEWKECFSMYAVEGKVPTKQLGHLMRCCGAIISNADISDLQEPLGEDFDESKFLSIMGARKKSDTEDELKEAFAAFGGGDINSKALKHALKSVGEKIEDSDVDVLYSATSTSDKASHASYAKVIV
eukprot:TRINITY_DN2872_c0_g1_i1.p1 TRINITY_DN2872_c0_g1~~TRINITY_DN2872_c0_g1_i1.p1  ORF type:complete len:129 (+),score=39.17 TRINITY_DN2872_c0_g1_i1:108-494(+)